MTHLFFYNFDEVEEHTFLSIKQDYDAENLKYTIRETEMEGHLYTYLIDDGFLQKFHTATSNSPITSE